MAQSIWTFRNKNWAFAELQVIKSGLASELMRSFSVHGDQLAIVCFDKDGLKISKRYEDLWSDCSQIVTSIERDIPPNSKIALLGANSYLFIVHLLALILRGTEVALLNPREGEEIVKKRMRQLGQDWVCLVDPALGFSKRDRQLEFRPLEANSRVKLATATDFDPEAIRFRVFTSGSTGHSKIVQQPERAILANLDATIVLHRLNDPRPAKRVFATPLPLYHVNALNFGLLAHLVTGHTLVLYPSLDWRMISASLIEDRVEVLSLFPILVQQFMHLHRSELANRTLPLKYVYTAASSLSLDLARAWFELTTVPLIQGYGMSEAINFTCSQDPYQDFSKTRFWTSERKRPSIGAPVRGNEVFILDPTGRQCDEGEVGELVVRGWNVMRGYEGDHSGTSQDYFHTGDIGYFENDPDTEKQFFFIQGRSKDVIKRSGETISLREVDEAIHNILLGSGYTGISVGFPNKHVGEEIGVVLRPAGELQVEPLGTLRLRLKNVPPLLRPRVGLLTHEELTTPSGKPQRWKFLQHFEKFEESLFAATLHLEEDFLR